MCQRLACVGLLHLGDLFGSALCDYPTAVFSAFGAEVDDPVGIANHVEIVLDDDDAIAEIGEPMEHVEQLADVVKVESGSRLVEQVERASGLTLTQFAREFDALRFAAGESDRGLPEVNVAEADVDQRL